MEKIDKISNNMKSDPSYVPPHLRNKIIDQQSETLDASIDTNTNKFPSLINYDNVKANTNIKETKIINDVSFAEQASRWKSFEDDAHHLNKRESHNKLDDIYLQQQDPFKNFKKRPTTSGVAKPMVVAKKEKPKIIENDNDTEWQVVNNYKKQRKPKAEKVYTEADFLNESSSENEDNKQQEEDTYWRNP
jgi:hypothetical protein